MNKRITKQRDSASFITYINKTRPKTAEAIKTLLNRVSAVTVVRQDEKTLTAFGRQAVGLDPTKPPKPPKTLAEIQQDKLQKLPENPWWNSFRGVDELQGNGTVKMFIENFLPEGASLICGLPKEGKSFLALSVAKALTSGQPLFGRPGFEVPEPVPVLYLAAESGDGALKLRCEKFGITRDKTKFISRTLSQGPMFGLDDPNIESLVKATFSDGAIIRYHGISPRTNHGIQTAKSPGEKFTELVRDKYRFTILKQAA